MITRGSRVHLIGDPRQEGTVYQINHANGGTFANVKWDSGIKTFRVPLDNLSESEHAPAAHTETELMQHKLKGD